MELASCILAVFESWEQVSCSNLVIHHRLKINWGKKSTVQNLLQKDEAYPAADKLVPYAAAAARSMGPAMKYTHTHLSVKALRQVHFSLAPETGTIKPGGCFDPSAERML